MIFAGTNGMSLCCFTGGVLNLITNIQNRITVSRGYEKQTATYCINRLIFDFDHR